MADPRVGEAQQRAGMRGFAAVLKELQVPNFAKWRWNTLHLVCEELSGVVNAPSTHLPMTMKSAMGLGETNADTPAGGWGGSAYDGAHVRGMLLQVLSVSKGGRSHT